MDVAQRADAERFRRVQRRGGDEHRRHADQRVERSDKLRQRRHLDAQRDEGANRAADGDAHDDQPVADDRHARMQQRRQHGDGHADHAEAVALAGGLRMRQAAQRQDEQHAGDEIGERGQVRGHRSRPIAFS